MNALSKWNDFKGAAVQMDDYDLPRVGHIIGVGEDPIHALIDVESRGEGFDKYNRPIILFERHYFYRLLGPGKKRDRAVAAGLATAKWSRDSYNKNQYTLLKKAIEIDERAALMSCSWGMAQIMGANFAMCGYASVQAMVRAFMADEATHIEAMIRFCIASGIDDELRALEKAKTRAERIAIARQIARTYNGPAYEKNRYHTRIVNRLEWWQKKPDTPWSPDMAKGEQAAADLDNVVSDIVDEAMEEADSVEIAMPPAEKKSTTKRDATAGAAGGAAIVTLLLAFKDTISYGVVKIIDRIGDVFGWIGGLIQ